MNPALRGLRLSSLTFSLLFLAACQGDTNSETLIEAATAVASAEASGTSVPPPEARAQLMAFFDQVAVDRRALSVQAMASATRGTPAEFDFLGLLDVPSVEATEQSLELARRHQAELAAIDRSGLPFELDLSADILAWQLDQQIAGADFLWHDFPVNQLMAVHNMLPGFMTDQHPLRDERDLHFYRQRLEQFPAVFEGTLAVFDHRRERGILPPRFAVEKTIRDSRAFIDGPAEENPLVVEIIARLKRQGQTDEDFLAVWQARLAETVNASVFTAYQAFIDGLEERLDGIDSNDGVWRLPEGEAYYRWLLRGHTTTGLGPEDIHELGLSEVERIEGEMDRILCGIERCEGTVGERMMALNAEPDQLFEDSDAGREAILAAYRDIVAEIADELDGWFHDGPTAPLEVQRVPLYREESAFLAYYSRSPGEGQPGRFFVNLRSVEDHPRFGLRTLAYHEAIPGHHLQISRMQSMPNVPDFRRQVSLHAHAEGWALYAEQLAWEMGFHDDPLDDLGRLQAELFRAVRLVVDTGMHHHRWSRERAIDYMHATTGMPLGDVVVEIERYLVIPGQATSFKVGMMRMLAMRERAAEALGDDFDIRDFHRVILDSGAMPLDLLDRVVDAWIAESTG
ncbi:MAG: DUF885 domain-containing protein [Wenzhouxiangella sp.]